MTEREQFEKWYAKKYISTEALEWDDDGYIDFDHNRAYEAFKGGLALSGVPSFEAKHVSTKMKGETIILTLELKGLEGAPRYLVTPVNPAAVRAAPPSEPTANNNASVAAIQFVLSVGSDGMDFLSYWNEGEFDVCRQQWPHAPDECYIGADQFFVPKAKS